MNDKSKKEADFGYKKVNPNEKPDLVKGVFDSVASKYDLMNDVMSCLLYTSPSPRDRG